MIAGVAAKAQGFPGTDSLRAYNIKYTTNNPMTSFTNLRLHTLIRGIIDWIDTARAGTGGGGAVGVDTLYALNDSTIRFRRNGTFYNTILKGVYDTRRKVDTIYKINDSTVGFTINHAVKTITIPGRGTFVDSIYRKAGQDSIYYRIAGVERAIKDSSGTVITLNNIGSGLRWVATPTGNIKTAVYGYGVNGDSTTNANSITVQADTTETNHLVTTSDLNDAIASSSPDSTIFSTNYRRDTAISAIRQTYGRVYNARDFGAIPDGQEKYTGVMTNGSPTLTCSSCSFTAADVGKPIRVEGAITGGDLVTTIDGFTNSTTVTLADNATRSVSNDTLWYGTDNTSAIQATIDAAFASGDGKVFIPAGFYILAGALVTSFQGANPNAQLVWDVADLGSSSFNTRKHVLIEGAQPAANVPSALFGDTLTAKYGTVLYSIINGSGTLPSVFGTKAPSSGFGFINYNEISFKDLAIFVARNKYDGGPSVGGINGLYSSTTRTDGVLIGIGGSINRQPLPTHDVAGLIVGRKDSEIYTTVRNTSVFCFKYGVVMTESASFDQLRAHACVFGHTIITNNVPVVGGFLGASWCKTSVYIPNHTLFNLISPSTAHFDVQALHTEVFNGASALGAPSWLQYVHIVSDSGSRGRGRIASYVSAQAEVGLNMSLFNKYNGDSIFVRQAGSQLDPNPRTFTSTIKANSLFQFGGGQNNGATGYFYNASTITDANILRAQPTNTNGSQGLYMSPTGTGSATAGVQSWINLFNTPYWSGVNSINSNWEGLQIAATGSNYSIKSIQSGSGSFRDLVMQASSYTDQFKLLTTSGVLISGNVNDQLSIAGNNATRASIVASNSNAAGNTSFYFQNNRGSFASYGGLLIGGSTYSTSFFGLTGADRTFLIHDGASGLGMGIGTLVNQPLVFGTNNAERIRITGAGAISFNTSTNSYTFPSGRASAGQVLTDVSGNGTLSWATPSSATTLYNGDGSLSGARTITGAGNTLTLTGTQSASAAFSIQNTGAGNALSLTATGSGPTALISNTSTGIGLQITSADGTGLNVTTDNTTAGTFTINPTTTNTTERVINYVRKTTGTAANNMAGSIGFQLEDATGATYAASQFTWTQTDATLKTTSFGINTLNAGTNATKLLIAGNGEIRFPSYPGTITGTAVNSAQMTSNGTVIPGPLLDAGTYTPTVTNGTNVAATTAYSCQYMRVGSVVTVSGKIDIDATATGALLVGLSLPITSAIANDNEIGGTISSGGSQNLDGAIRGDATNDRAEITMDVPSSASFSYYFTFTYRIL